MKIPKLDPNRDLFALTMIAAILSTAGLFSLVLVEKQAADAQEAIAQTHMRVATAEEGRSQYAGAARASWSSTPFRMERERPHDPRYTPEENAKMLRGDLAAYLAEFPPTKKE